jgi:hypothetical protein
MHGMLDVERNPEVNLIKKFEDCTRDAETNQEYEEIFYKKKGKMLNFLMQRRITISPTLILISRAEEEESNRVIRKFKEYLPNFLRLSIVGDDMTKSYYFGDNRNFVLGYIHQIITNGFTLGNVHF